MKNLTNIYGTTPLTDVEKCFTEGGQEAPSPSTSIWEDAGEFLYVIYKGFAIFAQEGGRNAGSSVR